MADFPSLDNRITALFQNSNGCFFILGEFIATNPNLWCGASTLEIGAGVAALPSMTALRCGAARVAFEQIRCNLERNFGKAHIGERVRIMGLDWLEADESLERIFAETPKVDFIFGSDVFYDPCVFESLVLLLQKCFDRFPRLEAFIAYQIRDSDWSLEELLAAKGLRCSLIRCVDTDQHSICLAKFSSAPPTVMLDCGKMTFAGIEG
uniref:Calmodulin-lysine N-methyltransferase n=1 Tax=Globodera pallida TaxID=36090 RepID=A0A183BY10_GLOPA